MGTQTLSRIQSLAQLYQAGYHSSAVDATIEKLVALERARLEQEIAELQRKLHCFEEKYRLSSEEFHRRFQAGELGDDADFFEWSAFQQMWLAAAEHLKSLSHEAA